MITRHQKEIKRTDGSKVRITVEVRIDYRECKYSFSVDTCQPRKLTWVSAVDHNDYSWRRLSPEDRQSEDTRRKLLHVTLEEVQSLAEELWQGLQPNFLANA